MSMRAGWVALLLCACGSERPEPEAARAPRPVEAPTEKAARERTLDGEGRLKPSGKFLSWLELPVGFEELPSARPRHHAFRARGINVEQTRDYLSERMLTGQVEQLGEAVIYRAVLPLNGSADAIRYDVTIAPREGGSGVDLWLDARSVPGAGTLSVSEARKVLTGEQARAE